MLGKWRCRGDNAAPRHDGTSTTRVHECVDVCGVHRQVTWCSTPSGARFSNFVLHPKSYSLSLLFSLSLSGRLKTQQTDTNPWVGKINNLYFLKKKKSKKFFLFAFLLSLLLLLLLPCVRHAASFRHGPGREEDRHAFHPFSTICLVLCLVAPVGRQMYAHGKCAHEKRQNV